MKLPELLRARLKDQYRLIPELLSGLPVEMVTTFTVPGKWSINDNLAHLARYNVVFQERLERMLQGGSPAMPRYVAEEEMDFPGWQKKSSEELIDSIGVERRLIFKKAMSLSDEDLEKTGIHPAFVKLRIPDWLEFFVLHEAHHQFTVFRLKHLAIAKAESQ